MGGTTRQVGRVRDLIAGQPIAWLTDFSVTDAVPGLRGPSGWRSPRKSADRVCHDQLCPGALGHREAATALHAPGACLEHLLHPVLAGRFPAGQFELGWADPPVDPRTGRGGGVSLERAFWRRAQPGVLVGRPDPDQQRRRLVGTFLECGDGLGDAFRAGWSGLVEQHAFRQRAAIGWQFGLEHHRLRITRVPSLAEIDASVPSGPAR